jgi:hypothetical protein
LFSGFIIFAVVLIARLCALAARARQRRRRAQKACRSIVSLISQSVINQRGEISISKKENKRYLFVGFSVNFALCDCFFNVTQNPFYTFYVRKTKKKKKINHIVIVFTNSNVGRMPKTRMNH